MKEKTLAIIKPDVVAANKTGDIISLIEEHGFNIVRMQKMHLNPDQVRSFYSIHRDKPFFEEIVNFMSHGPIVIMVLEKENAIEDWRKLMGATDPSQAQEGTIRKIYGSNIGANAVHGSDSPQTAQTEIAQFYPDL